MQCCDWQNWKQVKLLVAFIVLVEQTCQAIYKMILMKQNVCNDTTQSSSKAPKSVRETAIIASSNNKEVSRARLNIKTVLSTYGDFHVKDKTAVRTSYL